MTFGQILKKYINDSNTSIRLFSAVTGLNRGWLYNIFNGKKSLPEDKFHKMLVSFPFSEVQKKILSDAYYSEFFGSNEFKKINFIISEFRKLDEHSDDIPLFPDIRSNHNLPIEYVNGDDNLLDCITYVLKHTTACTNSSIYTNYDFSHEKIDSIFYSWILEKHPNELFHIIKFDNIGESVHNLNNIFCSLKYARNKINTFYYYDNEHPMQIDNIFPFFIITDTTTLMYDSNLSNGILINNHDEIDNLVPLAQDILGKCSPLVLFPKSVFHMKEYLSQKIDYSICKEESMQTVFISFEPCLAPYLELEMMESIATDNIPGKEYIIKSLYEWFTTMICKNNIVSIHTPKGLKDFAEEGTVSFFPSEYAIPLSLDDRIKILNTCIEKNSELNTFYLLDEKKIVLPKNFRIELSPTNSIIIYGTFDNESFSYSGEYLIVFSNNIMFSDFINSKEYIVKNHLSLNNQYTNLFLKDLILKLKASNNN